MCSRNNGTHEIPETLCGRHRIQIESTTSATATITEKSYAILSKMFGRRISTVIRSDGLSKMSGTI